MLPTVKSTKFTSEMEKILQDFSIKINSAEIKKEIPRLHKDNTFNKRFSGILEAFDDIKTVAERVTENIQKSIEVEREIQKTEEIDQKIHKEADKINRQNKTDLKTLYILTCLNNSEIVK